MKCPKLAGVARWAEERVSKIYDSRKMFHLNNDDSFKALQPFVSHLRATGSVGKCEWCFQRPHHCFTAWAGHNILSYLRNVPWKGPTRLLALCARLPVCQESLEKDHTQSPTTGHCGDWATPTSKGQEYKFSLV